MSHAPSPSVRHSSPSSACVRSQRTPPPGGVTQPSAPWHVRVAVSLPSTQSSSVFCATSQTIESGRQVSPARPVGVHLGLLLGSRVHPPRQLHAIANTPPRQRSSLVPSALQARAPS